MNYAMRHRPRRNRQSAAWRGLVRETSLSAQHLVLPLFVRDGQNVQDPVESMPGVYRQSIDLSENGARSLGLRNPGGALFPY